MAHDEWCDCPGCEEFRAVHGRLCPEVPRDERAAQRKADQAAQRRYELTHVVRAA